MKIGQQNKIRALPPSRTTVDDLAVLEKLDDWTEQPVREAASSIKPVEAPTALPVEAKPAVEGVVALTTRYPASVAAQIRFVAGSTYGMTINSFVVDAVTEKLARKT